MIDISQLQRMVETNNTLLGLMLENMIHIGKEKEKVLKSFPDVAESINKDKDANPQKLSQETEQKLHKVILNIIYLASTEDEECLKSCQNYADTLKELLLSYQPLQKIDMPEGTKILYQQLWEKKPKTQLIQDVYVNIANVIFLLYKKI